MLARSRRDRGRRVPSSKPISAAWGGLSPGLHPWGSDFNLDFNVSLTEEQQQTGNVEYNYQRNGHVMDMKNPPEPVVQFAATCGTDAATYTRDRPGMSAFVLEDGVIYHTYSTYARGLDVLWGAYQWLDRAPRGRNEKGVWWRRHDEYEKKAG